MKKWQNEAKRDLLPSLRQRCGAFRCWLSGAEATVVLLIAGFSAFPMEIA